jgi:hypothetical protein
MHNDRDDEDQQREQRGPEIEIMAFDLLTF